jgi:hypothetical protein
MQSGTGASSSLLGADAAAVSAFYFNGSNQASGMQALDGVTNFYVGGAIHAALTAGVFSVGIAASTDRLRLVPAAAGAGAFAGDFTSDDLTAAREWKTPDLSGRVQILLTGTAAPSATDCDSAIEASAPRFYHQTGDPATVQSQLFRCTQTGAAGWGWMPAGYQRGTAPPSTCTVGNTFFDTDATAGSNWFGCASTDTWVVQGGGLAAPGAAGVVVATGAGNTTVNRTIVAGDGIACANCNGVSGDITVSVDPATTPQTAVGIGVDTAWYSTKALTESAATSIVQVAVASGAATGGETKFSVVATDATDHQSVRGSIDFACANKAGTESCTISASDVTLTTSGTLVCAYTVSTTPANAIDLQLNCVSSLTQSSLNAYHVTTLYGPGTVTPQ